MQRFEALIAIASVLHNGESWDIAQAGPLQDYLNQGTLPRDSITEASAPVCLCRTQDDSDEQLRLASWLLALEDQRPPPSHEWSPLLLERETLAGNALRLDGVRRSSAFTARMRPPSDCVCRA